MKLYWPILLTLIFTVTGYTTTLQPRALDTNTGQFTTDTKLLAGGMLSSTAEGQMTAAPKTLVLKALAAGTQSGGLSVARAGAGLITQLRSTNNEITNAEVARWTARKRTPIQQRTGVAMSAGALEEKTQREVSNKRINDLRNAAWASIQVTRGQAVLAAEPMELAFLDLQIELRTRLEAPFLSRVPGLESDRGCQDDLVRDHLIDRYGMAAVRSSPNDQRAVRKILTRIAAQVACLSDRQMVELEASMFHAFGAVSQRLTGRQLTLLVTSFARLLAPIQVLIFDAAKHRGLRSLSGWWFRTLTGTLETSVRQSGWASGESLWLWDRHKGRLVGHSACDASISNRTCVDLVAFIRSLSDPRSIGFGYCSLSGMVAHGLSTPTGTASSPRYSCPSPTCSSKAQESPVIGGSPGGIGLRAGSLSSEYSGLSAFERSQLADRWPMSSGDLSKIEQSICNSGSTTGDMQSTFMGACTDLEISRNTSPFDAHAACLAKATGGGEIPEVGDFSGVPSGSEKCLGAPTSGESKKSGVLGKLLEWWKGIEKEREQKEKDRAARERGFENEAAMKEFDAEYKKYLEIEKELKELNDKAAKAEEERKQQEAHDEYLKQAGKAAGCADGDSLCQVNAAEEQRKRDEEEAKNSSGSSARAMCVNPEDCNDTCTALGKQLAEAKSCDEALLGALAAAAGRPLRGVSVERDLGRVSMPSPDAELHPEQEPTAGACQMGGVPNPRQNPGCGLILCPSAGLSSSDAAACRCGGASSGQPLPVDLSCAATMRCLDGVPTRTANGACTCTNDSASGGPPKPLPGGTLPGSIPGERVPRTPPGSDPRGMR